jgi:hypothetical protein
MNATTRTLARIGVTVTGLAIASVAVMPAASAQGVNTAGTVRVNNLANLEATTSTVRVNNLANLEALLNLHGVNTAGTVRVNNLANLEALL